MPKLHALDSESFLANFQGIEDVGLESIVSFKAFLPQVLQRLEDAINKNNSNAIHIAAHTLKGAVSIFYAQKSVQLASEIEVMGMEMQTQACSKIFLELKTELAVLLMDLDKLQELLKAA